MMNRKYQRKIDSVQDIIGLDDLDREINTTDTRIFSARESMGIFWWVLLMGILIGSTSIGTAWYYGQDMWTASGNGLMLALAVFAVFSLQKHIFIWLSIRPEEEYKKSLVQRRSLIITQQHSTPHLPPRKQRKEPEEFE